MKSHRRAFLAASGTALALARPARGGPRDVEEAAPATRAEIPTPALLVDLDALEANIQRVAEECRRTGRVARPHAKTHKCVEIARRQVAAGAVGASVATVAEAEAMAAGGVASLLLTSPILDPRKIERMVRLVRGGTEARFAVGHPRQMELLAEAASAHNVALEVFLDLDVGDGRFGIPPGDAALELARLAARSQGLRLVGIQAYSGMSSHVHGFEERAKHSRAAMAKAVAMRERLERAGLRVEVLSGGSSGTYNIDSTIDGVTELQVGSYVFMDVGYRSIGGPDGNAIYADFRPSLTVLATVVSASHADRVTIDAGIKAFSTDTADAAQAVGRPDLKYRKFGDEFGLLTSEGGSLPRLGERLAFLVPHCDPTVNLYDWLYALRGDRVEAVWPIVARRQIGAVPS